MRYGRVAHDFETFHGRWSVGGLLLVAGLITVALARGVEEQLGDPAERVAVDVPGDRHHDRGADHEHATRDDDRTAQDNRGPNNAGSRRGSAVLGVSPSGTRASGRSSWAWHSTMRSPQHT